MPKLGSYVCPNCKAYVKESELERIDPNDSDSPWACKGCKEKEIAKRKAEMQAKIEKIRMGAKK